MEKVQARLRIHGRVQGVGYRASFHRQARSRGLTGWVRNLTDGTVEAVAEGPRRDVEEVVAWCRTGPPGALVTKVEVSWHEADGELNGFATRD